MSLEEEDTPCPDCPPGEQVDENGYPAHLDGCPRIDTLGQIGPPWVPGPWPEWCHDKYGFQNRQICMRAKGHEGKHGPFRQP